MVITNSNVFAVIWFDDRSKSFSASSDPRPSSLTFGRFEYFLGFNFLLKFDQTQGRETHKLSRPTVFYRVLRLD